MATRSFLKIRKYSPKHRQQKYAINVAMAAPATPRAGAQNNPKIRMGSRIRLINAAVLMTRAGVKESPLARMAEFPLTGTESNADATSHMGMYC